MSEPKPAIQFLDEQEPKPAIQFLDEQEPKPAIQFWDEQEPKPAIQFWDEQESKPAIQFWDDAPTVNSPETNIIEKGAQIEVPLNTAPQTPPEANKDLPIAPPYKHRPNITESLITGRNEGILATQGIKEIYTPIPSDLSRYTLADREQKDRPLPVKVYEDLKNRFIIRIFQNNFYVFDEEKRIYSFYSDDDFDREIINRNYKNIINCKEKASVVYDEIKKLLRKEYDINIKKETDISLYYWVFQNGLFDLENNRLLQNDGSYFVRHALQCNYNPMATCPNFDRFVDSIAGGDQNLSTLIWETIGYLLSNDINAKVFFLLFGVKDSGKSLLGRVIESIVGKDWVSNVSPSDLGRRFGTAPLLDKTLNSCLDLPDEPVSAEAVRIIKAITGQDRVGVEEKFKADIFTRLKVRFLFASNHLINSTDTAFIDRMVIIPFQYPVPKQQQIFNFENILLAERDGIAVKAIHYYRQLVAHNYIFTKCCIADTYCKDIDNDIVISHFAEECCEFTDSQADKISSADLFSAYNDYCHLQGIPILKQNTFSEKFTLAFSERVIKSKIRIGLKTANGFSKVKLKKAPYNSSLNRI